MNEEKRFGRGVELNEDDLMDVSGGVQVPTPQPSRPSIPPDPGLASSSIPLDPALFPGNGEQASAIPGSNLYPGQRK